MFVVLLNEFFFFGVSQALFECTLVSALETVTESSFLLELCIFILELNLIFKKDGFFFSDVEECLRTFGEVVTTCKLFF